MMSMARETSRRRSLANESHKFRMASYGGNPLLSISLFQMQEANKYYLRVILFGNNKLEAIPIEPVQS